MKSCLRNQFASVFSSVFNRTVVTLCLGIVWIGSVQGQQITISNTSDSGINWNSTTRTFSPSVPTTPAVLTSASIVAELANGPVTISTNSGNILVESNIVTTSSDNLTISTGSGTINIGSLAVGNPGKIEIGGALTISATNIDINNNLAGSAVTLNAKSNISTGTTTTRTVSTSGSGNITLAADSDANGSGQLNLDYLAVSTVDGNIIIRGETLSWSGTSPAISSSTGNFTLEPSDASFGQEVNTNLFAFGGSFSNFTVGKSGNSSNLRYAGTSANITSTATFNAAALNSNYLKCPYSEPALYWDCLSNLQYFSLQPCFEWRGYIYPHQHFE